MLACRYLSGVVDLTISGILWGIDELSKSAQVTMGLKPNYDPFGERSTVKSMAKTYTPGARTLTGRDHFFNRPQSQIEDNKNLDETMRAFHTALDAIESPKYPFKY